MLALDEAALLSRDLGESERFKVLLAALYHDTGKIDTTEVRHVGERKKISAINHEEHSWLRAKRELKALGLSRDVVGEVCALVRHHMRPLQITSREGMDMPSPAFDNQVRMLVRDVGPNRFDAFMILCRADRLGRGGGVQIQRAHDTLAPVQEASDRKGFRQTAAQKLLKGADLIELGFQPDEQLWRDIIVEVEKRRDDGKLGIPEEARRYVLRKYGLSKQEVSEAGVTTPQQLKRFYTSLSGAIKSGEVSSVAGIQEFLRDYQGASSSGGDPKHGHESDRELPEGALTFSVDTLSLGGQHVPLERGEHGGAGPSQDQGARTSLVSVLPKLSQSDTAAILSSGGVSAEGVSVNGQWSYAVRRSPADTFERMELEFRDLKDRLPRLSGISADISDVTLQFVTGSEADQIRRLGRRKIIEGEPFLAVSEESLRAVGLSAIEAFYKPEEKRIYVVKEAVENQPEWTTRSLLTHELTHALQVEGFPDFHKSIARFVSWGIRHSSVGSSASASALPIVAESVRARLNWLERHATYFEQCAFQYLIDDENDFTSIVRFAVNEDLLDLGKFRVPPSKEATEDIVAQIFATPEIADLLFRDDGVVCLDLDDRRREQSLDLVERFAKRYLKRSDVHVYSISSGKFVS
jgi:hypothetical protein